MTATGQNLTHVNTHIIGPIGLCCLVWFPTSLLLPKTASGLRLCNPSPLGSLPLSNSGLNLPLAAGCAGPHVAQRVVDSQLRLQNIWYLVTWVDDTTTHWIVVFCLSKHQLTDTLQVQREVTTETGESFKTARNHSHPKSQRFLPFFLKQSLLTLYWTTLWTTLTMVRLLFPGKEYDAHFVKWQFWIRYE